MTQLAYHCQCCGAGNPVGLELCRHCGTRLLLIVEPPSSRFEVSYATPYEEYLLERLTLYENYVSQLAARFDKVLSLMSRQAETAYLDHTLLESVTGLLSYKGFLDSTEIHAAWMLARTTDARPPNRDEHSQRLKAKFLAGHRPAPAPPAFINQIDEGIKLLKAKRLTPGVGKLEQALLHSPGNTAVLNYLGLYFYRANKAELAKNYLAQSLASEPGNGLVCLLLGLLCGDSGSGAPAQMLLAGAQKMLKANFVANYALGRLLAAEGSWREALSFFKQALRSLSAPEAYYAVGCAYFHLRRFKLASRAFSNAVEADEDYAEAWYGLGLAALHAGHRHEARELFCAAAEAEPAHKCYRQMAQRDWPAGESIVETPSFTSRRPGKRLISGGNKRLAGFLRAQTLRLCASLDESEAIERQRHA